MKTVAYSYSHPGLSTMRNLRTLVIAVVLLLPFAQILSFVLRMIFTTIVLVMRIVRWIRPSGRRSDKGVGDADGVK